MPVFARWAAIFAFTLAALPGWAQSGGVSVSDAWARATPGGAPTGAAYFTLANKGQAPDTLLSESSPAAKTVELHSMTMQNGVMEMRPAGPIALAPGQSFQLKPGGYHVMLIGLKQPLKEGDSFPLTLTFAKAGDVTVQVKVGGVGSMAPPSGAGGSMAPPGMSGAPGMGMGH